MPHITSNTHIHIIGNHTSLKIKQQNKKKYKRKEKLEFRVPNSNKNVICWYKKRLMIHENNFKGKEKKKKTILNAHPQHKWIFKLFVKCGHT